MSGALYKTGRGWACGITGSIAVVYSYADSCRTQRHNEDERHSLLEKYTSHFIWKVACERELETERNCNILTPTLMAISVVSFSFSRAAQPEAWGPTLLGAGFLYRILLPTGLVSKLTDFLSSPSYIIVQIAHSISPRNWPSGCVTSAVLGIACLIEPVLPDTWRNSYRRWFPKLLRRQSSGGCWFNPHYRRVTIQEYLTLVPGYG